MEGEVVDEIARRDDLVVFDRGWWETLKDKGRLEGFGGEICSAVG